MSKQNDQIFQLSLTEFAFTIAFVLLLLLGYLVFKEQSERLAAEAELAKVQSIERSAAALADAKSSLSVELAKAGIPNSDEVLTKLVAVQEVRAERDRLRQQVEDLDAKLTALTELQERLETSAKAERGEVTRDEVVSALALQEQVRRAVERDVAENVSITLPAASTAMATKSQRDRDALAQVKHSLATRGELRMQLKAQLDKDLKVGAEGPVIREVVAAAKGYIELQKTGGNPEVIKKENADLRGQVAFMKIKLDARGGRDYPPCWADEEGKVQFLFAVEVKPDLVLVAPAWPPQRESDARALGGLAGVLSDSPHSNQKFISAIQGIFNSSKAADPQCRHYVQLKSSISDAVQSDRARLMVENYFYKSEVRR